MKTRISSLILAVVFAFPYFAQEAKKSETPAPVSTAPKVSLEDHDKAADLERKSLELQLQLQAVTKRYEDALNGDAQYQELKKQAQEIGQQFNAQLAALTAKVDAKKWRFDTEKLEYVAVAPDPGSTPVQNQTKK